MKKVVRPRDDDQSLYVTVPLLMVYFTFRALDFGLAYFLAHLAFTVLVVLVFAWAYYRQAVPVAEIEAGTLILRPYGVARHKIPVDHIAHVRCKTLQGVPVELVIEKRDGAAVHCSLTMLPNATAKEVAALVSSATAT